MTAPDSPATDIGDVDRHACSIDTPGSPYIQAARRTTASDLDGRVANALAAHDRPLAPKTKNEFRQAQYLRKLSLQRQKQMEQEEAERDRIHRMRRNAREAVVRRAQELSPTRKLSHSLSVPPASTTRTPPIAGKAIKPQRSSSTSRISTRVPVDLPPCDRRSSQVKAIETGIHQSPPKGYHKFTERLQAYIRSQSHKQPLELISSGAVTKEDRRQRQEQWRAGFERWKSGAGIAANTKVFIVRGGYPFIRQALLERGWHENKDVDSDFFDYKWTLKTKHVHPYRLHDCQYVNHFCKSFACLTTKVGLLASLKDVHWHAAEPALAFHPRAYNLSLNADFAAFDLDFKWTAAASLLRMLLRHGGFHRAAVLHERCARVALRVCHARLDHMRDLVEADVAGGASPPLPELSEEEWALLTDAPAFRMSTSMTYTSKHRRRNPSSRTVSSAASARRSSAGTSLAGRCSGAGDAGERRPPHAEVTDDGDDSSGSDSEGESNEEEEEEEVGEAEVRRRAQAELEADAARAMHFGKVDEAEVEKMSSELRAEVLEVLAELRQRVPQWELDGPDNIWILKPGGKSRGRGIHCFNNLAKLRHQVRTDSCQDGQAQQLVAQKYLERPLLAFQRKFDLRQWVLVSSWEPLTVWFYRDCYLRFCAEDYKPSNFDNIFCHLSNNSIAKKSRKFKSGDATGQGNMWTSAQFAEWLQATDAPAAWPALQNRMKQIVMHTLVGAQDTIDKRARSFELFGYDFIMDTACNVWLLEINCSPTFEHSTPITSALVRGLSADIVRVTVDVPAARAAGCGRPAAPTAATAAATAPPPPPLQLHGRCGGDATAAYLRSFDGTDTGGFECIFRDLARPPGGCGVSGVAATEHLSLSGKPLKLPPKASPNRPSFPPRRPSQAAPTPSVGASLPSARGAQPLPVTTVSLAATCDAAARGADAGCASAGEVQRSLDAAAATDGSADATGGAAHSIGAHGVKTEAGERMDEGTDSFVRGTSAGGTPAGAAVGTSGSDAAKTAGLAQPDAPAYSSIGSAAVAAGEEVHGGLARSAGAARSAEQDSTAPGHGVQGLLQSLDRVVGSAVDSSAAGGPAASAADPPAPSAALPAAAAASNAAAARGTRGQRAQHGGRTASLPATAHAAVPLDPGSLFPLVHTADQILKTAASAGPAPAAAAPVPTQAVSSLPAAGSARHKAWQAAAKGCISKRSAVRDAHTGMLAERSTDSMVHVGAAASLADAGVTEGQIARIIASQLKSGARFRGRVSAGGAGEGRPGSLQAVAKAAAGAAAARMGLKGVDVSTSPGVRYAKAVGGNAVVAPGWAVAAARRDSGGA
eukprot:jgi/Ulvmu1/5978/UM026_0102.1